MIITSAAFSWSLSVFSWQFITYFYINMEFLFSWNPLSLPSWPGVYLELFYAGSSFFDPVTWFFKGYCKRSYQIYLIRIVNAIPGISICSSIPNATLPCASNWLAFNLFPIPSSTILTALSCLFISECNFTGYWLSPSNSKFRVVTLLMVRTGFLV